MPRVRKADTNSRATTARRRPKKPNGLTCRGCRSRKIRCDGAIPACGICVAYGETQCHYDKAPPMSQIIAMTERIAELERIIRIGNTPEQQGPAQSVSQDDTGAGLQQPVGSASALAALTSSSASYSPRNGRRFAMPDEATSSLSKDAVIPPDATLDCTEAYYETTSAMHPPQVSPKTAKDPDMQTTPLGMGPSLEMQQLISAKPEQIRFWEARLVESGSILLNLPHDTIQHLFDTHWTWVHPAFMFLQREAFVRDGATAGCEYFSPLLLTVVCLHSTRFTHHHLGDELMSKFRLYFGQEIHKESTIPLVQALLQYSAYEFGRGQGSQAWLFSGMAFRIAVDLSLFSDTWAEESSDQEMDFSKVRRKQIVCQLAWACFSWDKTISLYFGRLPTLQEPPKLQLDLLLGQEQDEQWPPNAGEGSGDLVPPVLLSYKYYCFVNFCKLAIIINDVLLHIYGNHRTKDILAFVQGTRERLRHWRANSPVPLRLDLSMSPETSPPHILGQNMIYYTTIILLHRPFRGNSSCRAACRDAAKNVEDAIIRMEKSFGLSKCTYVMAYCAYTAATVAVQDTKDGIPGAKEGVSVYLRALKAIKASCPGIQRSIAIIRNCLEAPMPSSSACTQDKEPPSSITAGHISSINELGPQQQYDPFENMPTFPFVLDALHDLSGNLGGSQNGSYQHNLYLDAYPQDWFSITDEMLTEFNVDSAGYSNID